VKRADRRRGAAVVEFAVCIPIIVLLILGSIEATSAIFLRQALTTAAYEGIREAARPGADSAQALARVQSVLSSRQVRGASIRFTPSDVLSVGRGDIVSVEVEASFSANSPFMGRVIADRNATVRTVMVKE
jgi:Flp pilus assembly protein TadG